jgi:hypothetical protein
MTDWDSASLKLNRVGSGTLPAARVSTLPDHPPAEPEIDGKWRPRTTLIFILVSCVVLWAGIFAAVFSLI